MVLNRRIAEFNRHVTNRVLGPFSRRVPGFGTVVHVGRKSGREYRTPVNIFPTKRGYVIALTYGPGADWVRNVLAAGGCDVVIQGRTIALTAPEVVHDEHRAAVPWAPRQFLGLVGVTDFLHLAERS